MVIMVSTSVTYTAFSMNQVTEMAEVIETKQVSNFEQSTEEFEIVKIKTDLNQFNMTLKNTGQLPIHLTRLWVENTTLGSTWPTAKYDLDLNVASGATITNIGQDLGLTALDTQSYMMNIVTERGNSESIFLNSVGTESLNLSLHASPTTVSSGFTSTLRLQVINNGTTQLLNLQPVLQTPVSSCTTLCSAVLVSGPTPTNFESLDPGDTANFEWIYTINGDDSGDTQTFTASLQNGLDSDSTVVTIQTVDLAENSNVSLESGGVTDDSKINDDVLLFHAEQSNVPSPGYQMMSADAESSVGLKFEMDKQLADSPISFLTNNGTQTITIPAGTWTASLDTRSAAIPVDLQDRDHAMIFHFEDGDGIGPDNSEGDADRDLEECGTTVFQERIQNSADDAEQRANGHIDVDCSGSCSPDHELVYDAWSSGSFPQYGPAGHGYIGLRWSLDVPQGAIINSADIRFRADETDTGSSPNLIIGAEDTDNASAFTTTNSDISNRWDGTTNSVTFNTVVWDDLGDWSTNDEDSDTTTRDLSSIVQEIVDRPGWVSGNHIVFMFKDNSGGTDTDTRVAEHFDSGGADQAARLTVSHGGAAAPDWQSGTGPHGSGSYYYSSSCHRSANDVSSGEENDLGNNDNTTSLWFKAHTDPITSEQMLVFWQDATGTYPNNDYYKISIGSDPTARGKILFAYDTNGSTAGEVSCLSTNEYNDDNWYHIVATRDRSADACDLYITDTSGIATEPVIHTDANIGGNIDISGKWYVGTAAEGGYWYKGWIDDIMHWNNVALDSTEANAIARTDYGNSAHQIGIKVNVVDSDGNFISSAYDDPEIPIEFHDPLTFLSSDDRSFSKYNVTMSLPQVVIQPLQKLNFTMYGIPSSSTWEALELDLAIDDTDYTDPFSSFVQFPMPDNSFPSYIIYDNDDSFVGSVNNIGTDGVYFVYPGTRLTFDGSNGAFAAFASHVNGTSDAFAVTQSKDSLYIASGETAQVRFFPEPTDHPCNETGSSCASANVIPAGEYSVAIWINGYTDRGETFGRSVTFGTVSVVD